MSGRGVIGVGRSDRPSRHLRHDCADSIPRVTGAEMRADPEALSRLASRTMVSVDVLTDAVVQMVSGVQLAPGALGPTPSAAVLHSAAGAASEAAHAAFGAVGAVWETDADNLLQAAVAYREADVDEAAAFMTPWMGMGPR